MLKKVLKFVDKISEWVGKIDSFLLIVIIFATFYEVIVRYFLHKPTSWSNELSSILFAVYMMLGGCYVLSHDAHVRMDIFSSKFSARTKAIVGVATYFLGFAFLVALTKVGAERAWTTIITNEHSTSVWAPSMIPFRACLPIGCALFLLQSLANFVRDIIIIVKGEEFLGN